MASPFPEPAEAAILAAKAGHAQLDATCWLADWAVGRMSRARLLNVSLGGALIETHEIVTADRALNVGRENASELGSVDAEVVRFEPPHKMGIRFTSPYHPGFILAATLGIMPAPHASVIETTERIAEIEPTVESKDEGPGA